MLSVLIPANNEENCISACLEAILKSTISTIIQPQIIIIANGCTDKTTTICQSYQLLAQKSGWQMDILDIPQGGKLNALNLGDKAALYKNRIYLDADVTVSPPLIDQIAQRLEQSTATYVSGTLEVSPCTTWVSRAYRRIYLQVPFITQGVPGCGLFAINATGRERWGEFPDIISDDTFVRLQFKGSERFAVSAPYQWPIVEGFANLVKVRRRQNIGVAEIAEKYPQLLQNDDKPNMPISQILRMFLTDPIGFSVYAAVALATRIGRKNTNWSRGR